MRSLILCALKLKLRNALKKVRPTFERPPLVEQAITVIFEQLPDFSIGDFGLFWTKIQSEFPYSEAQTPIDGKIEGEAFRPQQFQLRLLQASTLPRCFYRSDNGSELVQLQPNRFSFNWLGTDDTHYPRSEATMARFHALFARFKEFVAERDLGTIKITQCELVNVNIIAVADFGESFAVAPLIFEAANFGRRVEFLQPESYMSNTQQAIMGSDGFVGRLYAEISPVTKIEDGAPAYRFEITARGAPAEDNNGVQTFFDYARNALNGSFLATTTEHAQKLWGLKNG
ncbi:Putative secreted protein [Sphingopyxis fribergensis]|uniref:Putative secreted protein n=1 Tax=Sphingopyxis fribergensis TaxID=1515612 RepID=A0A0A7PKQ0_9SPHN|nr:TIGR04255 family protein [Sphingopyxis fribergensis]AJA10656.1 Putative secreted protein [Sphingopyxis fribergensis]